MFWLPQLPVEVEARIIGLLSGNEIACTIRLVNKAAAQRFRGPQHTIVRLSQPVPEHAFKERCEANQKEWIRALPYKKRLQLLCLTAASGDLPNLEVASRAAGCALTGEVMAAAAAAGHIHVCQRLRQMGCPWGSALGSAAGAGRREVCEWMLASGCPLSGALVPAAKGGHMDLAVWLQQQGPEGPPAYPSHHLVAAAAHGCDLATLKRLYRARQEMWRLQRRAAPRYEWFLIFVAAAGSPTPDWREKVEWLEDHDSDRVEHVLAEAASRPDAVDRLRWLRERGHRVTERTVVSAAAEGNVAALQYLLGEGCVQELCPDAVHVPARNGHLAALQVLLAHGVLRGNTGACLKAAAEGGQLAVVVWLVDTVGLSVADLQAIAVVDAVRSGSMELMCWLAERGCDFTRHDKVLEKAAKGGCEIAMEWLLERGCRWPGNVSALYTAAANNGDLATLACLRRLGCPWGTDNDLLTKCIESIYNYGICQPLPVLRWLVDAGCSVDWGAALEAVEDFRVLGFDRDDIKWAEVTAWLMEEQQRRAAGSS